MSEDGCAWMNEEQSNPDRAESGRRAMATSEGPGGEVSQQVTAACEPPEHTEGSQVSAEELGTKHRAHCDQFRGIFLGK